MGACKDWEKSEQKKDEEVSYAKPYRVGLIF
jgi:hypothetical protein